MSPNPADLEALQKLFHNLEETIGRTLYERLCSDVKLLAELQSETNRRVKLLEARTESLEKRADNMSDKTNMLVDILGRAR